MIHVLCQYVAFDRYGKVNRSAMILVKRFHDIPAKFELHMQSLVANWRECELGPKIHRWRLVSWLPERRLHLVWDAEKVDQKTA